MHRYLSRLKLKHLHPAAALLDEDEAPIVNGAEATHVYVFYEQRHTQS